MVVLGLFTNVSSAGVMSSARTAHFALFVDFGGDASWRRVHFRSHHHEF